MNGDLLCLSEGTMKRFKKVEDAMAMIWKLLTVAEKRSRILIICFAKACPFLVLNRLFDRKNCLCYILSIATPVFTENRTPDDL